VSFEWKGDAYTAHATKAAADALNKGGAQILTQAKKQAPVKTGALVRSGRKKVLNGGKTVEISFNTPYAHYQHEMALLHPKGGKRKYLEDPLRQYASVVLEMVRRAVGGAKA
jgi:hypothetical protein